MFTKKKALLLDMNSTFMFGEDRFEKSENFSKYYNKIGGTLSENEVNDIIRSTYKYLNIRYPDEKYRHNFPSLENAISNVVEKKLSQEEIGKIIDTCSGLIAADTLIRDNYYQLLRCHNESETNIQAIY